MLFIWTLWSASMETWIIWHSFVCLLMTTKSGLLAWMIRSTWMFLHYCFPWHPLTWACTTYNVLEICISGLSFGGDVTTLYCGVFYLLLSKHFTSVDDMGHFLPQSRLLSEVCVISFLLDWQSNYCLSLVATINASVSRFKSPLATQSKERTAFNLLVSLSNWPCKEILSL